MIRSGAQEGLVIRPGAQEGLVSPVQINIKTPGVVRKISRLLFRKIHLSIFTNTFQLGYIKLV